jgi:hypothetical protein
MEDSLRGQMIQGDIKILKKAMEEGRHWKVETIADERDE